MNNLNNKKLYKGWEIAKLLTEKKLVDGTRIQQYIDKQACDYEGEYEVVNGELFTLIDGRIGDEVGSSVLISDSFEFDIIEKDEYLYGVYFINQLKNQIGLDQDKLITLKSISKEQSKELMRAIKEYNMTINPHHYI